jgi:hypothetical protein
MFSVALSRTCRQIAQEGTDMLSTRNLTGKATESRDALEAEISDLQSGWATGKYLTAKAVGQLMVGSQYS